MNFRYVGFEQAGGRRLYQFECEAGRVAVMAELALFAAHGVSMQEGPALSAQKLAKLGEGAVWEGLELTAGELRSYAAERAMAASRLATARKRLHNRPPARQPRSLSSGHWG